MATPIDPNSSNPPASPASGMSPMGMTGKYQFQPMTFLGMEFDPEQTKKLWDVILQSVSAQIEKDKKQAIKTIRNLGKEPGDPDYEQ